MPGRSSETLMSREYAEALAKVRLATQEYNAVVKRYRSREIGDDEYLAARAIYQRADQAFEAVAAREARRAHR